MVGSNIRSWAYHGHGDHLYGKQDSGKKHGSNYGTVNIIGCGVDVERGTIFFTKDRGNLGQLGDTNHPRCL